MRKVVPSTNEYDGQKIFTRRNGKRLATPLFAVLVLIETTDVVFAVDSIPAILAVSREQFIVFSSNAFAILGLRALYFCLAGMAGRFRYLNVGLGVILAFVGIKMLITELYHFPTWLSLVIIIGVLTRRHRGLARGPTPGSTTPTTPTDAIVEEQRPERRAGVGDRAPGAPGPGYGRAVGILAEDVERVRTASPIDVVVGEHVGLRRSGSRYVGLCPFHAEKTPSFSVNAELQVFHCFGCQA